MKTRNLEFYDLYLYVLQILRRRLIEYIKLKIPFYNASFFLCPEFQDIIYRRKRLRRSNEVMKNMRELSLVFDKEFIIPRGREFNGKTYMTYQTWNTNVKGRLEALDEEIKRVKIIIHNLKEIQNGNR